MIIIASVPFVNYRLILLYISTINITRYAVLKQYRTSWDSSVRPAYLVKSWTSPGLSVTLSLHDRNGIPVSESRSSSWSTNRNSFPNEVGERHGIFWLDDWEYWWWIHEFESMPAPLLVVAAAAVALLSSFLNRIPQALHNDCIIKFNNRSALEDYIILSVSI